ncbi:MAG: biotin transporter BioY [Clostridia bacterium]|nr:biotin transporter BioY [Clostridia bacterium]
MKLTIQEMTRVALFSALIAISSLILKFGGELLVPFSILPLVVMLAGAILGARLGAFSVTVYVLIGLMGAPVFSKPPFGGVTYIFQPTFGFILGFIGAAYVTGWIVEKIPSKHIIKYMGAMTVGILVMYMMGVPYLYGIMNFYLGKSFSMWKVIEIGVLPFIGLDLIKAVIAGAVAKGVVNRVE